MSDDHFPTDSELLSSSSQQIREDLLEITVQLTLMSADKAAGDRNLSLTQHITEDKFHRTQRLYQYTRYDAYTEVRFTLRIASEVQRGYNCFLSNPLSIII